MSQIMFRWILVVAFSLFLLGCTDGKTYAPVMDANTIDPIPRAGMHKVSHGETLYSIAWRYGLDYRYVARLNHFTSPYNIYSGQLIALKPHTTSTSRAKPPLTMPIKPVSIEPIITVEEPTANVTAWHWPARGKVIGNFSEYNKGINIKGRLGDPIYATAPGKVVYSGSGLRGYGNLIIIKHNSVYLTAYAHNSVVLVKEGSSVRAGQKIAEMGNTGARQVMLHFEIRRGGQPVNPLKYLRIRNAEKETAERARRN